MSRDLLYGLDARTGKQRFKFSTPAADGSAPVFLQDTLYKGTTTGKLIAVDLNTGKTKWSFSTNSKSYPSEPSVSGSTVYVSGRESTVYALNAASGKEIGRFEFKDKDDQVVDAIASGDDVIAVSIPHYVAVIDMKANKELFRVNHAGNFVESISIENGSVYFIEIDETTNTGNLRSVDLSTGKLRWTYEVVDPLIGGVATIGKNTVYYEDHRGHCHAVNALDGKMRWSHNIDTEVYVSASTAVNDKVVCVSSKDGTVVCLDRTDGQFGRPKLNGSSTLQ